MQDLAEPIRKITERYSPESIFLYGSRARADFLDESDYELGVIFQSENYISRSDIRTLVDDSRFSIYPFRRDEILNSTLDTPFQKTLYLWDIKTTGKTLWGETIVEELVPPKIQLLDLLQDIRFCLWCATAAHISHRNGDVATTRNLFYRSCLYWARDYLLFREEKFVAWYKDIFNLSKMSDFWEYQALIDAAYMVRLGREEIPSSALFMNIKFLNKFVEDCLLEDFKRCGNRDIISR